MFPSALHFSLSTISDLSPDSQAQDDLETVTFGNITIRTPHISEAAERLTWVRKSTEVLERGLPALLVRKPGVRIKRKKGVPLYYTAPNEPEVLIRELDGKTMRDRMVSTRCIPDTPKPKRGTT